LNKKNSMKNFKNDFPFLQTKKNGNPFIFLDSAATTPKPECVIDALTDAYTKHSAPVHRGIYAAAEETTTLLEKTRKTAAQFFNASSEKEIIFTSGTTESLNLVAFGFFSHQLKKGDQIVISELEHNANVLPWQQIAKKTGATLDYISVTESGDLDYDLLDSIITKKTKVVSIAHASNAIGTLVDINTIIGRAKKVEAFVCIDAAQTAAHMSIDVQDLDIDFLVCSSHKMYGPHGVGILYAKKTTHDQFFPLRFGGGIVLNITHQSASLLSVPTRLEAGTPPIAEIIALKTTLNYITKHRNHIEKNESEVFVHLLTELEKIKKINIIGSAPKLNTVSFTVESYHAHDIATLLDQHNIAVRAGTHCAHLVSQVMNYRSSIRVSIGMYTEKIDIDRFIEVVK